MVSKITWRTNTNCFHNQKTLPKTKQCFQFTGFRFSFPEAWGARPTTPHPTAPQGNLPARAQHVPRARLGKNALPTARASRPAALARRGGAQGCCRASHSPRCRDASQRPQAWGWGRRAGQRVPSASSQAAPTALLSEGGLPTACSCPLPAVGPAFTLEKRGLPAPASAPTPRHLCPAQDKTSRTPEPTAFLGSV